jgi:hypothetical protein
MIKKKGLKIIFKKKRPEKKRVVSSYEEKIMASLPDEKPVENGNGAKILTAKEEMEIERSKWRGRRKMAGFSLASMIFVILALLFGPIPETRIKVLEEPLVWFFFSMASVIGAYMGFTTWASKGKKGGD